MSISQGPDDSHDRNRLQIFYILLTAHLAMILSDLHKKRSPTQCDIHQMLYWYNWFSWWWARGCSKHVDNWNKYIEKNRASCWSFTKIQDRGGDISPGSSCSSMTVVTDEINCIQTRRIYTWQEQSPINNV